MIPHSHPIWLVSEYIFSPSDLASPPTQSPYSTTPQSGDQFCLAEFTEILAYYDRLVTRLDEQQRRWMAVIEAKKSGMEERRN